VQPQSWRRYRTIYVCGGLGLGSTRAQDQQALRRLHDHLEPGGRLVLDNEVPYADETHWGSWPVGRRGALPEPDRPPGERRLGSDGFEYALQSRLLALDPLLQQQAWEMHAYQWRDGALVAEERHRLTLNLYFAGELVMMLERPASPRSRSAASTTTSRRLRTTASSCTSPRAADGQVPDRGAASGHRSRTCPSTLAGRPAVVTAAAE
jgi:hypothetical protein